MQSETISWKSHGNFQKRHLIGPGQVLTYCERLPQNSGPWSVTREDFAAFFTDPTSCLDCAASWLRNRGRELHREDDEIERIGGAIHDEIMRRRRVLLGKPRSQWCQCEDPKDVTSEFGAVWCNECHSPVSYP